MAEHFRPDAWSLLMLDDATNDLYFKLAAGGAAESLKGVRLKLGEGIAVAFVATIYGVGLANLVFLPMSNKLKSHINRLIAQREMIVDGLVGIANGDNPRIIESRLQGYIF